jgi:hypothetical protein
MKLWIIALAISAAAGCGHSEDADEQSASKNVNQTTEAPTPPQQANVQQPANPGIDTGEARNLNAPGMPANAPKPKPEKPKPRPKQEALDFTK